MAEIIGIKLGKWFFKNGYIDDNQIDEIRFGFEILCSEMLEFLIIIIYGLIKGSYLETIIYIMLFRVLRSRMQGYHAKTIWKCFILTVGSYVCTLYTYQHVDIYIGGVLLILTIIIQGMYIKNTSDYTAFKVLMILHALGVIFIYWDYEEFLQLLCILDLTVSVSWLLGKERKA